MILGCITVAVAQSSTDGQSVQIVRPALRLPATSPMDNSGLDSFSATTALARSGAFLQCNLFTSCTLQDPISPARVSEYESVLATQASAHNHVVIIGSEFSVSVLSTAANYPATSFTILDHAYPSMVANVNSISFRDDQIGFLAGVVAAGVVGTNGKIGIVSSIKGPAWIDRLVNGFVRGVKHQCPTCELFCVYMADGDAANVRSRTESLVTKVQVVFGAGGGVASAAIRVAAEKGAFVIGSMEDEFETTFNGGSVVGVDRLLTSTTRDVKKSVRDTLRSWQAGEASSSKNLDIASGYMALAPCHLACNTYHSELQSTVASMELELSSGGTVTGVDTVTGRLLAGYEATCTSTSSKSVQVVVQGSASSEAKHGADTACDDDVCVVSPTIVSSSYGAALSLSATEHTHVVGVAMDHSTALAAIRASTNARFTLVGSGITDSLPNTEQLDFAEEQAGFLAGAVAGLVSQSRRRVVGAIGGQDLLPIRRYVHGFANGVMETCPDCAVYCLFADDLAGGRETAKVMVDTLVNFKHMDVVFGAGGLTGNWVLREAAGNDTFVIGADADQWMVTFLQGIVTNSDRVLTSALRNVRDAVAASVRRSMEGTFEAGVLPYDLSNAGVGLAPPHGATSAFTQQIMDTVDELTRRLTSGALNTGVRHSTGQSQIQRCLTPSQVVRFATVTESSFNAKITASLAAVCGDACGVSLSLNTFVSSLAPIAVTASHIILQDWALSSKVATLLSLSSDLRITLLTGTAMTDSEVRILGQSAQHLLFADDQGGFLAGIVAGAVLSTTTKQHAGIVSGLGARGYVKGFASGVRQLCPQCKVSCLALDGTHTNQHVERAVRQLLQAEVNLLFEAGAVGPSLLPYAAQRGVWVIGADTDAYEDVFRSGEVEGSERLLTSVIKHTASLPAMISNWTLGTIRLHVANGGVSLAPCRTDMACQAFADSLNLRTIFASKVDKANGSTGLLQKTECVALPQLVTLLSDDDAAVADKGINKLAANGLEVACKEKEGSCLFTPPVNTARGINAVANIAQSARLYDYILTTGFTQSQAVFQVARDSPQVNFAVLHGLAGGMSTDGQTVLGSFGGQPPNVEQLLFREDQAGYLAGLIAGRFSMGQTTTKPRAVGALGATQRVQHRRYVNGFANGVKRACPTCEVFCGYANSEVDTTNGAVTQVLRKMGFLTEGPEQVWARTRVLFASGGVTASKALLFAAEQGAYVIGADDDHHATTFDNGLSDLSPQLLTSAKKNVQMAVRDSLRRQLSKQFKAGTTMYGVDNGGVSLAGCHAGCSLNGETIITQDVIERYTQLLRSGELTTGVDWASGDSGEANCKDPSYTVAVINLPGTSTLHTRNAQALAALTDICDSGLCSFAGAFGGGSVSVSESFSRVLALKPTHVIFSGYSSALEKAALTAAKENPGILFTAFDFPSAPATHSNFERVLFAEDEAGYLAGALAGLLSESKLVGTIGGDMQPSYQRYISGFGNGVRSTCATCTVFCKFTMSLVDQAAARAMVDQYRQQGVDVIFAAAGEAGSAALVYGASLGTWVIGSDVDEWTHSFGQGAVEGAQFLAGSAVRQMKKPLRDAIQRGIKGGLASAKPLTYDLQSGEIQFTKSRASMNVSFVAFDSRLDDISTKLKNRHFLGGTRVNALNGVSEVSVCSYASGFRTRAVQAANQSDAEGSLFHGLLTGMEDGCFEGDGCEIYPLVSMRTASAEDADIAIDSATVDTQVVLMVAEREDTLVDAAMQRAAMRHPAVQFVAVNAWASDWDKSLTNLQGLIWDEDKVAFLAGTLAGAVAVGMTSNVGIVGSFQTQRLKMQTDGFMSGVKHECPLCIVYFKELDAVDSVSQARSHTRLLADKPVDVLFAVSGVAGRAAVQQAAQLGIYVVGIDTDIYVTLFGNGTLAGADRVLGSVAKDLHFAGTLVNNLQGQFAPGKTRVPGHPLIVTPCHEACNLTDASAIANKKDYYLALVQQGAMDDIIQVTATGAGADPAEFQIALLYLELLTSASSSSSSSSTATPRPSSFLPLLPVPSPATAAPSPLPPSSAPTATPAVRPVSVSLSRAFNQLAVDALDAECTEQRNCLPRVMKAHSYSEYRTMLSRAAATSSHIIALQAGRFFSDLSELATVRSELNFTVADWPATQRWSSPNVEEMNFAHEQAGFLAGVLAGTIAKTARRRLASLGGELSSSTRRLMYGYARGAKTVCPQCRVFCTFTDQEVQANVLTLLDKQVDVLFVVKTYSVLPMVTAAGVYVIGSHQDVYHSVFQGGEMPGADMVLASVLFDAGKAVQQFVRSTLDRQPLQAQVTFDLAGGDVHLSDCHLACNDYVTHNLTPLLEEYAQRLRIGNITFDREEAETNNEVCEVPTTKFILLRARGEVPEMLQEAVFAAMEDICSSVVTCSLQDQLVDVDLPQATKVTAAVAAAAQSNDHVVALGQVFRDAVFATARVAPAVKFSLVQQPPGPVLAANVETIAFREDEAAFLAGVLAGFLSTNKNRIVGVVAGPDEARYPSIRKYAYGFANGVAHACPDCQTLCYFASNFNNDNSEGTDAARALIAKHADVIFGAGGATGSAAITEAAKDEFTFVIGSEVDEYHTTFQNGKQAFAHRLLTSAVKNVVQPMRRLVERGLIGEFEAQQGYEHDLANGGVGLAPCNGACDVWSDELQAQVDSIKQALINGQLSTGIRYDNASRALVFDNKHCIEPEGYKVKFLPPPGTGAKTMHISEAINRGGADACKEGRCQWLDLEAPEDNKGFRSILNNEVKQSSQVVTFGSSIGAELRQVAEAFPNRRFTVFNAQVQPALPNVENILFAELEAGLLVGYVAGAVLLEQRATSIKRIGAFGAVNAPEYRRYVNGFASGVKMACPSCKVYCNYGSSLDNTGQARGLVEAMHAGGVEIFFAAGGDTAKMALQWAARMGLIVIGADVDVWETVFNNGRDPGAGKVLTSAVKDYETAVTDSVRRGHAGQWEATTRVLGIKERGVKVAGCHGMCVPYGAVSAKLQELVKDFIAGTVDIPVDDNGDYIGTGTGLAEEHPCLPALLLNNPASTTRSTFAVSFILPAAVFLLVAIP